MKFIMVAALAVVPLLAVDKGSAKRLEESAAVFSEIMAAPDKGIPQDMLENAHCIVIVPGLRTAAFVFGGKYGKGYLSCRNKVLPGWSAPATVRIEGGSVGFQIGGSQTDLIMLVMNERGADKLLSSKFTLGAEGSVAAGPVGRTATAQTDAQMHAEILSWSRSQGLFAGLALEGATLRQDQDDNVKLYGRRLENRQIVTSGMAAPRSAAKLLNLLNKYSARERKTVSQLHRYASKKISAFLLGVGILAGQSTQAPNPTQQSTGNMAPEGAVPIYRVTVVARSMKAINYNHRSGSTQIGFRGTALMPAATGEARVESKQGVIKINADMQKLEPATKFGPEYLTYVMWAITPEGRATNVGEILLNGSGKSKLDATTELQSFGLIVTAEPYFAVTQPSDVVVMENFVRRETTGTIEELDAKFELLQRGQYTLNVNPAELRPRVLDRKVPLELYEARNAVQIARWTGAERYAADTFQKAVNGLLNAEGYLKGKSGSKPIGTVAREAVQMAEDARIITVKKIEGEILANERQSGMDREARAEEARMAAQRETRRIAEQADAAQAAARLESQRVARENDAQVAAAQAEANRIQSETEARLASARSEADRLKRETDAQVIAAQNEAERLKRQNEAQVATAQNEAERLKRQNEAQVAAAQVEAERLKAENEAQKSAANAAADRAARERAQAEVDKAKLRAQLMVQFNTVLQTRDTARGLIVNMSDVLFDTGKFTLRAGAREKLARVAGILAGHPGLQMQVEGYTDSVGSEVSNQQLSERRATSVRDYLTGAGIPGSSVNAKGLGETLPVASNDTASGRQQNRRVELVVSGDIIGGIVQPTALAAGQQ